MLGNSEKLLLIPSPSNDWPQNNQIYDQKVSCLNTNTINNNMGSVGARVVDQKITAVAQDYQQQQQQNKQQNQEPLRCPRCDSINTKFCYYNNYSLSQPRHFCKACKRYWTRGGTLRNVPVGGGCRKNKRVRRSSTSSSSSCSSLTNPSSLDANNSASSDGLKNPLFYRLPTNHSPSSDINFPFSRYDLQNQPQINGLGLGFSSSSCGLAHIMNGEDEFRHGLTGFSVPGSKQTFQDLIFSNPLLSNYTTTTNRCSSATISSLLGSSLQIKGPNSFQTLLPLYENGDPQMKGCGQEAGDGLFMKEVKMGLEEQSKSIDHHAPSQNQMDQTMGLSSSDPSLLWGGGLNNLGSWLDPANNIGFSVTSFI